MTGFRTDPVMVLGMHRSGTSLLTGTLQENGLHLGEVNTYAANNKRGNREFEPLQRLHEKIFAAHGATWKDPPRGSVRLSPQERDGIVDVLSPFRNSEFWGYKDPRTIWLIEEHLALFPRARLIGIFRHPDAVARSLAARPGVLQMTYGEGLELWFRTNLELARLCRTLQFPILQFDSNDANATSFKRWVAQFLSGLGYPDPEFGYFEKSLVHQTQVAAVGRRDVMELFEELETLTRRDL